ncbi:MAG: transcriptional regulator [Moraxellaceae bacterium]|jgi:DNA transformation protein|nr:transcriptional regulator [Moraxellaceae bacterium]
MKADAGAGQTGAVPLSELQGLGPKSCAWLAQIGITTADQLRARDPFEVYARLCAQVPGMSLNMLYALIGAIEDRHWQDVRREQRTTILLRLEQMGLLK